MSETLEKFEGNATRTEQDGRFDLIPVAALNALARRLKMGAAKHGERNWESGGAEFEKATLSHGIAHLQRYAQYGLQDDLDGAICNLAFLCHFAETRRSVGVLGGLVKALRAKFGGDVGEVESRTYSLEETALGAGGVVAPVRMLVGEQPACHAAAHRSGYCMQYSDSRFGPPVPCTELCGHDGPHRWGGEAEWFDGRAPRVVPQPLPFRKVGKTGVCA